jgi:hypothetical protein
MKTTVLKIVFAISVLIALKAVSQTDATSSTPSNSWEGTYVFKEHYFNKMNNYQYFVTVYKEDWGHWADIDIDGFHMNLKVTCKVAFNNNKLDLYFKNYRHDNFGDLPTTEGVLLSLSKNDKNEVMTTWGVVKPVFSKNEFEVPGNFLAKEVNSMRYLRKYAGQLPKEVFKNESLVASLQTLVGENYEHLMFNISNPVPVKEVGDYLYISGWAPQSAFFEGACIVVDMKTSTMYAAIYTEGKIVKTFPPSKNNKVPEVFQNWIEDKKQYLSQK